MSERIKMEPDMLVESEIYRAMTGTRCKPGGFREIAGFDAFENLDDYTDV